jgi:quercetin dioxygenase-like cupin family protein
MSENPQPRMREHPATRFEGSQHVFDLNQLAQQLQSEAHGATQGHRQIAFGRYGAVTQVLFAFEAGGKMDQHAANGLVVIHVLSGALQIEAEGQNHDLQAGQVLMLAPDVRHDVRATEAALMLLTVHRENKNSDGQEQRAQG